MAHAICEMHGVQPAELVTNSVIDIHSRPRGRDSEKVFPVTLTYEGLEYPGYGTEDDRLILQRLGGIREPTEIWRFADEAAMERAIGLFSAICAKCLTEVL